MPKIGRLNNLICTCLPFRSQEAIEKTEELSAK